MIKVSLQSLFLLFCVVWLSACGGGGSDSGGVSQKTASYTLDPNSGPTCNAPDNISRTNVGGGYSTVICSWNCAIYNGKSNQNVTLGFSNSSRDRKWKLVTEQTILVSDAACNAQT